jgi:hypothetical protein
MPVLALDPVCPDAIELKQRTLAGLPHLHVIKGNILAALGAGTSWFFTATIGWPQTLQARAWLISNRRDVAYRAVSGPRAGLQRDSPLPAPTRGT